MKSIEILEKMIYGLKTEILLLQKQLDEVLDSNDTNAQVKVPMEITEKNSTA